ICGISRATTAAHLARAALEGIALQNVEILQAMEADSGRHITALKVDGGACANDLLMQIQADCLGCRIVRPKVVETTALGAAYLAGLGAGLFTGTADIEAAWKMDREFLPQTTAHERASVLEVWRKAVAKA
ncbi:MAG: FGGY-family carbohydrate kinase, partial [Thermodesulfobacteriota bacterium]